MADLSKTRSFALFHRSNKTEQSFKLAAEPPTEDISTFSYLVEDGTLEQGDERQFYYKFVTELVDDATRFSEEVNTYPYLRNTRGSVGALLFRLTNEINYFRGEMDKIEREFCLDFEPKELAILEVILRIARDRFDSVSKPGELRSCVERLASRPRLHPLQTRKDRATLIRTRRVLVEARVFSAQCRIGFIREHRAQGKLENIEANVREVMLPVGQSETPKSQESRSRKNSLPRTSIFRASQPPKVEFSVGNKERIWRKGPKGGKGRGKDMAAAKVTVNGQSSCSGGLH